MSHGFLLFCFHTGHFSDQIDTPVRFHPMSTLSVRGNGCTEPPVFRSSRLRSRERRGSNENSRNEDRGDLPDYEGPAIFQCFGPSAGREASPAECDSFLSSICSSQNQRRMRCSPARQSRYSVLFKSKCKTQTGSPNRTVRGLEVSIFTMNTDLWLQRGKPDDRSSMSTYKRTLWMQLSDWFHPS